jgi:hypothetical protein
LLVGNLHRAFPTKFPVGFLDRQIVDAGEAAFHVFSQSLDGIIGCSGAVSAPSSVKDRRYRIFS